MDAFAALINIFDSLSQFGSAIMQPLYWAVSGIIVLAHKMFSPLFGADSGVTWTLSIAFLTVVIRTLLMPLYARQLNSSRAMQAMQPKLQELQAKYGSDRERLGQETMKLYNEEGVNPTASCLPLLLQLPIFWGLYRVLYGAAQGHAIGHWFVQDPSLVDSLSHATLFGAQLSGTFLPINGFGATQIMALVLIAIMVVVLFFQQLHMMRRNMPPAAFEGPMGQQQKMMLYMMPAMYIFIGPNIPIGVLVYWVITNVWTMVQQWVIIRNYPTPGTPAYIEWEERMEAKGKDPKAIERARAEKGRSKKRGGGIMAAALRQAENNGGSATVARQGTNRSTVRNEAGKQVITRQQVTHQTRAQRKKK